QYLQIAARGYGVDPASPAFFPLFPLLIYLAGYLTGGSYLIAGLIVTLLSGAASAVGVWALAARVCDRRVADRAVLLYCLFPGAMTFSMLYSDSLAVALGAAFLLALLEHRWLLAGIIGAAGTAERPSMIILAAVSGVAALQAIWTRREWLALLTPAITSLGVLAYFYYLGRRFHDYARWFWTERAGWHQHYDGGAATLRALVHPIVTHSFHVTFMYMMFIIMLAVTVAGMAMMIAARLPLPVTLLGILPILTVVTATRALPILPPRYVWAAFPLFIGAAAKLPRAIYWPVLVLSAACLIFLVGWWPHHLTSAAP
ncbi:MAG: hypothetical protein JO037_14830, partial [Actinobacteria bacterium]|nr:hypothetical protein [Actinomycetota bacterium]